ncbi:MAG: TetR/AcrR family transcriptional regulator [Gammaproteobacteria bacterium]|nr:TetR/AcrR family transcriptional regulator [Gammaproteobacteria bacterium]
MNTVIESKHRLERKPDKTRRLILEAAYQEIYHHGYQGMRLDVVLSATGLTKGALYHHFPNKQALGYAVVDEVIYGLVQQLWTQPLAASEEPLGTLIHFIGHIGEIFGPDIATYGCPVNNLAQEMSPIDEGFRIRLDQVYLKWRGDIQQALERAQRSGDLRGDLNCGHLANFVLASISGCIGAAKNAQSLEQLQNCGAMLVDYLQSLRTP